MNDLIGSRNIDPCKTIILIRNGLQYIEGGDGLVFRKTLSVPILLFIFLFFLDAQIFWRYNLTKRNFNYVVHYIKGNKNEYFI